MTIKLMFQINLETAFYLKQYTIAYSTVWNNVQKLFRLFDCRGELASLAELMCKIKTQTVVEVPLGRGKQPSSLSPFVQHTLPFNTLVQLKQFNQTKYKSCIQIHIHSPSINFTATTLHICWNITKSKENIPLPNMELGFELLRIHTKWNKLLYTATLLYKTESCFGSKEKWHQ